MAFAPQGKILRSCKYPLLQFHEYKIPFRAECTPYKQYLLCDKSGHGANAPLSRVCERLKVHGTSDKYICHASLHFLAKYDYRHCRKPMGWRVQFRDELFCLGLNHQIKCFALYGNFSCSINNWCGGSANLLKIWHTWGCEGAFFRDGGGLLFAGSSLVVRSRGGRA